MAVRGLSGRDVSIVIGNAVDHFDSALYGFLAPVIGLVFFPSHDPIISIILAYSIFITSVITRPLGALIFGFIAHKYGALKSLYYSLIGVAITTMMIGVLPSHNTIGFVAPLLLVVIRGIREIFSAGEMSIAKLYILEGKNSKESIRASYIYQTSTMLGIVCASFLSLLVIRIDSEYAWRICFLLGGLTAIVGFVVRSHATKENLDSHKEEEYKQIENQAWVAGRIWPDLWRYRVEILKVALVVGLSYLTYGLPFIVMNSLIPLMNPVITFADMMASNTILLVLDMFMLPIIGSLLLNYNARKIILYASVMLFITLPIGWYFLLFASQVYIDILRIWIIILGCIIACSLNVWCNSLIAGKKKYIIVGIGHSLGTSFIGKMTPAICMTLYYYTSSYMVIMLYVSLIAGAAILSLIMPERVDY